MNTKEEFIKHVKAGQPTKYKGDEHIGMLYDTMGEGEGVMAFCAEASISQTTFNLWLRTHKEFKNAHEIVLNKAGREWEKYPKNDPDFNIPYWSAIMRNRYGYGKSRIRASKDKTPLTFMGAIREGLEEGELGAQEAVQLASVANTHANIIANTQEEPGEVKVDSVEDILAKVSKIKEVLSDNAK